MDEVDDDQSSNQTCFPLPVDVHDDNQGSDEVEGDTPLAVTPAITEDRLGLRENTEDRTPEEAPGARAENPDDDDDGIPEEERNRRGKGLFPADCKLFTRLRGRR